MTSTIATPITPGFVSVFPDNDWAGYQATIQFTGRLIGGSPSDPKLVEGWLGAKLGITDEEQLRAWTRNHLIEVNGLDPADVTDEDLARAIEANASEKKAQVFKRTPDGRPYVEGRHIKAMLKEATNVKFPYPVKWGQQQKPKGGLSAGKTPVNYFAERVFVPEQPYVVADDSDGFDLAVGHVDDGFGGKRSTIGYFEYCTQPSFSFTLKVLDDCITGEQWAKIMKAAEHGGLGARRSQGAGQFVTTAWERI
jgi:hypothetical protein